MSRDDTHALVATGISMASFAKSVGAYAICFGSGQAGISGPKKLSTVDFHRKLVLFSMVYRKCPLFSLRA
jgi:hypothetical protein